MRRNENLNLQWSIHGVVAATEGESLLGRMPERDRKFWEHFWASQAAEDKELLRILARLDRQLEDLLRMEGV